MHELAVAQGLISEAERIADIHGATKIDHIVARVGALSGVEAQLLERAFLVARAGSRADAATLEIETGAIAVRCRTCGATGVATHNRLICGTCGEWRVDVTAGEELLLVRLALSGLPCEDGEGDAAPAAGSAASVAP
ncbi:MAG: hydrogenase maturation nickel metallochaperone HypA [Hyphomicrobium sp.]